MIGMSRSFQPFDGPPFLLTAFGVVIIGGLGSLAGCFIGGIALGITQVLAGTYFGPAAQQIAGYLLILLVLAVRPQGLFVPNDANTFALSNAGVDASMILRARLLDIFARRARRAPGSPLLVIGLLRDPARARQPELRAAPALRSLSVRHARACLEPDGRLCGPALSFGQQVFIGLGGFAQALLYYYAPVSIWVAWPHVQPRRSGLCVAAVPADPRERRQAPDGDRRRCRRRRVAGLRGGDRSPSRRRRVPEPVRAAASSILLLIFLGALAAPANCAAPISPSPPGSSPNPCRRSSMAGTSPAPAAACRSRRR